MGDISKCERVWPMTPLVEVLSTKLEPEDRRMILEQLMRTGCDVNFTTRGSPSPLGMCSRTGDYDSMTYLLEHGARMTEVTSSSRGGSRVAERSAICELIDNGDTRGLCMFIQHGADIYRSLSLPVWYGGITDLVEYSCHAERFGCTIVLLTAGCSVTEKSLRYIGGALYKYLPPGERGRWQGAAGHLVEENTGDCCHGDKTDSYLPTCAEGCLCDEDMDVKENTDDVNKDETGFTEHRAYSGKRKALRALLTEVTVVKSLRRMCRNTLRRDCGLFTPRKVELLPLPRILKSYILCRDLNKNNT